MVGSGEDVSIERDSANQRAMRSRRAILARQGREAAKKKTYLSLGRRERKRNS
jgi:hypothetical protein